MKHLISFFTLVICCSSCCVSKAFSQYYFYNEDYYDSPLLWNTGVAAGGMNCLTDLGGRSGLGGKLIKDINWQNTKPCAAIFIGAVYGGLLGARLDLTFGQVMSADNILKNDVSAARHRYTRNLNFRSQVRELSLSVELYLFAVFDHQNISARILNPYVFAGVGCFSFSPETHYNNSWISLADLHTEGQGFDEFPTRRMYRLTQLNMPLGLGLNYEASPIFNFRLELCSRKLWTDYLDDVSKTYVDPALFQQYFSSSRANLAAKIADRRSNNAGTGNGHGDIRGNDSKNDSYFTASVKLVFVLGRQKRW